MPIKAKESYQEEKGCKCQSKVRGRIRKRKGVNVIQS